MLSLGLAGGAPLRRVLALGAHADDIEIGCGGTMLALSARGRRCDVHWVVLAAEGKRADEARASAEAFLAGVVEPTVEVHAFRDGYFPYVGGEVKDVFEELKAPSTRSSSSRTPATTSTRIIAWSAS